MTTYTVEMYLKTGPVENTKFPWYKERLQTKYLRDLSKTQQLSGAYDGRRWRFLCPGLDDFRDGYPTVHEELFTRCECGMAPAVFGMPKHSCAVKFPQKRINKDQAYYSKHNPQSQTQREFIDAVEHRLQQHPLALYPHLETGMTSELFDQVLSVLDPDMCVREDLATTSRNEMHFEDIGPQREFSSSVSHREAFEPSAISPRRERDKDSKPTNPYKWQEPKESLKDQITHVKHLEDEDKLRITRLFCEWINSLGGDNSDLTESTILDLFKSDYEKKPLSSPIKNKTPAKLDSSGNLFPDAFKISKTRESSRPQTSKTRMNRDIGNPLKSPDMKDLEFEGHLSEHHKVLKESYAIQAFRQYIFNKSLEMPRFLRVLFSEEELKDRMRDLSSAGSTRKSKGRASKQTNNY